MKTKNLINQFGGKAVTLAAALGLSPAAITHWGEVVPRKWQLEIKERWPKKHKAATAQVGSHAD